MQAVRAAEAHGTGFLATRASGYIGPGGAPRGALEGEFETDAVISMSL